jgi:glycosyltransferase involved in cell wall biosynthesis
MVNSPNSAAAWPRISVITPSYNQGAFLEAALESVLSQGYPNLEYIVIDGGSTDDSRAIIERYAPRLAYWVSERDKGQTDAINKGFARATGEVMGWLNSDDLLLPGSLHAIGVAFRDEAVNAVCGFRRLIEHDGKQGPNWIRGLPRRHHLQRRNILAQETVYWRRDVWEKLGALDTDLRFCMDYEYWLRMLAAGYQFKLLPHYVGGFRFHEDSKTATLQDVYWQELDALLRKYGIAQDAQAALKSLGVLWPYRYDLIKDLCHQPLFNDPQRALWTLRLLETPVVSWPILGAYSLYRRLVRP